MSRTVKLMQPRKMVKKNIASNTFTISMDLRTAHEFWKLMKAFVYETPQHQPLKRKSDLERTIVQVLLLELYARYTRNIYMPARVRVNNSSLLALVWLLGESDHMLIRDLNAQIAKVL